MTVSSRIGPRRHRGDRGGAAGAGAALARALRRRWAAAAVLAVALPLAAGAASAQGAAGPPTLLRADRIELAPDGAVSAVGNVEIRRGGAVMRASRITYHPRTEALSVTGPIVYVGDDETVLLADSAEIDSDLRNGLLVGARLLVQQQMQMAAAAARRIEDRYVVLERAVGSACRVCDGGPPLWQIRAERAVRDTREGRLSFTNARFELMGVPVLAVPRLSLPDSTVRRASGFLVPRLVSSSTLGFGVKLPWFQVLGDHADLTVTPYFAAETATLGLRYRRALRSGTLSFSGALSSDTLEPGRLRWYLEANGAFALPRGFGLSFGGKLASDADYAGQYGLSESDRLESHVTLARTRRLEHVSLGLSHSGEDASSGAGAETELRALYERRFVPSVLAGQGRLGFDLHLPDAATGSDRYHATATLDWARSETLAAGLRGTLRAALVSDAFAFRSGVSVPGADADGHLWRHTATLAGELRWPLVRRTADGGHALLEPLAQVAWTGTTAPDVPNEDALLAEFDEGNLLALGHFPGKDAVEEGFRAALGLSYARQTAGGARLSFAAGRIFRDRAVGGFSALSGLDGRQSDWLVASQLSLGDLTLAGRALIDDGFSLAKAETRASLALGSMALTASYLWLAADSDESRLSDASEIYIGARFDLGRNWTTRLHYRYDFTAGQGSDAGVGIAYRNECVQVGLSWRNRIVATGSGGRDTTISLDVGLNGIGNDGRPYARRCAG